MIRKPKDMPAEDRPNMRGGPGTVTLKHYFKPEDFKSKCRLCAKLTLPPGAGIGVHKHETEDEVFIILKGQGILDDGSTKTKVAEGDSILTGNGASHAITNDGTTDLEIAAVIMTY
jgi:mannose-6-phosphate isomerase-like protein (cupin superfamily)